MIILISHDSYLGSMYGEAGSEDPGIKINLLFSNKVEYCEIISANNLNFSFNVEAWLVPYWDLRKFPIITKATGGQFE